MKKILAIAALALATAACNTNYEKTPTGLAYKIFTGKGGSAVKDGKFLKMNIEYRLSPKDSVLNTTYGKMPQFVPFDTAQKQPYSVLEILPKMKEGDSAIFTLIVDSLVKRQLLTFNETFKRGDQIKCKVSVLKVYKNENDVRADYEKEMTTEKTRETKSLQDYMNKKGIKAELTKNGALVSVENAGDPNTKAVEGKSAKVMYKGYLQESGKVFDTNMDSSKGHTDPIDVVVGRHQVIPAWEEALPYFGKGGKGKILVPAMLGYGPQGSPGGIPPYANLIFDIEVKDVTDAPPQAATPPMGGGSGLTPAQMKALQEQMQKAQQNQVQKQGGTPNGGK